MKLHELLKSIGINVDDHKQHSYNHATRKETILPIPGTFIAKGQCHGRDLQMINNHLNDELEMFVRFGPFAIFALKIPTAQRFALFTANSLGMSNYSIERYSMYRRKNWERITASLEDPAALAQFRSEKFSTWELLSKLDRGEDNE